MVSADKTEYWKPHEFNLFETNVDIELSEMQSLDLFLIPLYSANVFISQALGIQIIHK